VVDLDRLFSTVPRGKKIVFTIVEYPNILNGFKPTIWGEPRWGLPVQLRKGKLHAYDYGNFCEIHRDKWNPETHPLEHLRDDAPHWLAAMAVGSLALGAFAWNHIKNALRVKAGRRSR
jgi:hypothetical protein